MLDGGAPHGLHYYWKSHRVPELSDAVIDVLTGTVDALTSPFKQIGAYVVGGAASRVPADATAVGDRAPGYELNITAIWPPPDPTPEAHVQWVRDVFHALSRTAPAATPTSSPTSRTTRSPRSTATALPASPR